VVPTPLIPELVQIYDAADAALMLAASNAVVINVFFIKKLGCGCCDILSVKSKTGSDNTVDDWGCIDPLRLLFIYVFFIGFELP